jgi:hypothetical protein
LADLADLRNRHRGETIWVLGSGPSLNFIDPEFFDDKTCVTANQVGVSYPLKAFYSYSNYHASDLAGTFGQGLTVAVMLAHDTMTQQAWPGEVPDNVALSEAHSYSPPGSTWDPYRMPPPEGQIVYGSSSIHGATHLAAHLGAKNIILVGHDAGFIDDGQNLISYPSVTQAVSFRVWNEHSILLKRWLGEKYGARVYSLNPFINFNLEGHTFRGVND